MSAPVVAVRLRALGDLTLCTAALHSLAEGHPGREVHVVTESRFAPLLEGQPQIARVWPVERTNLSTLRVVLALRSLRPAVAVDFFGNSRSAVIARLSGARHVWGFDVRGRSRFYHHTVPRVQHAGEEQREYAAASQLRLARAGAGDPARTVGLVPAGSWATKTWPLSHSAVLARRLLEAGHPVLAIGGPGEERLLERLAGLAPGTRTLRAPDVAALAGAIAPLRALVGTDSGPRHLAVAFGLPTYTWFGPAHPGAWTPDDPRHGYWRTSLPCRACERTVCPHWNCLPALTPEDAAARVLEHLQRFPRSAA